MENIRERNVNKLIEQEANGTIGASTVEVENNECDEKTLNSYKEMTNQDWYNIIYSQVIKQHVLFVRGGMIEMKQDIRFLGKEKIMDMIAKNEYVINCLEEMDDLLADK